MFLNFIQGSRTLFYTCNLARKYNEQWSYLNLTIHKAVCSVFLARDLKFLRILNYVDTYTLYVLISTKDQ